MPVYTSPVSHRICRAMRSATTSPVKPLPATPTTNTNTVPATKTTQPDDTASPLLTESFVSKTQRAFERNRQVERTRLRTQQRQERKRAARERIASQGSDCRHCREGADRDRRGTSGGGRVRARGVMVSDDDDDADVMPLSPQVEEIIAGIVEREAQAKLALASEPVEVHLDELVKPGKPRKSKAGEFELVPGMPVVIALDDLTDDTELDESWEHISTDELDEKRDPPPTYATVVANAAWISLPQ